MHDLDGFLSFRLSGVPLGPFSHLQKIVNPCDAQKTQELQPFTIFNEYDYISTYEILSTTNAFLEITLTVEVPSSDFIITPGFETILKEHSCMNIHHFDFILREVIAEPSLFIFTHTNEGYGENCSLHHVWGFPGSGILDFSIDPTSKINTYKKEKFEDANFSVFMQCLGLARGEDDEFHHYHYYFQGRRSSHAFASETLAFPSLFIESTTTTAHTLGAETIVYKHKGSEKKGDTFYLLRNTGLVPHYTLALRHMEPTWTPGLKEEMGQRMPRFSESADLSLERQRKATLWTIETMLCS